MTLWNSYRAMSDCVYIGKFDPPLMFKKVNTHLIYSLDKEESNIDITPEIPSEEDPFSD